MTSKWYSIAKAEYQVSTSSMRSSRTRNMVALLAFGLIWAIFLAPFMIGTIMELILPFASLQILLVTIFPGLMRAVMFFLWMIILIIPLSRALQEIKIGQWEILLSNDVRTRDIMIGSFLGKLPIYGLLVLYLAPPFFALFFLAFEVTLIGQILIYLTLFIAVLTTIWLSNLITVAIQAKLGESPRGKDIANGVGILLAIVSIVPMYGIMFFSLQFSAILGLNVFLIFPFTWPADVISWITILFSQIGLTPNHILIFQQTLQFDIVTSTTLLGLFAVICVGIGLGSADRIFTYNIGARTEQITTIKGENVILRGIRKVASGSFGTLLVTCLKDFFRKASNLSRIAYGIILAIVLPFIMTQMILIVGSDSGGVDMMMVVMISGISMALIGSFAFSGTAFMESKDQLWIIQSTPSGTTRYVKARLIAGFLIALPLCIIPALAITILITGTLATLGFLLIYGYIIICGAIMFSTGVTALNPYYEDTKSPEHQMNVIVTTMGVQFTILAPIMILIFGDIFGLPFLDFIRSIAGPAGMPYAFAIIGMLALLIIGSGAVLIGNRRLAQPEV
ncbi:MAG: hypothetical protein ACFFBX_09435 [Promethearchaeota archaeon]